MPSCAVFRCIYNTRGVEKYDLSLHKFPVDPKMRKLWETACKRIQLPRDPRLCSLHFTPDSFESFDRARLTRELIGATVNRRLRTDAVPTVFFNYKQPKKPRVFSVLRSEKRDKQDTVDALLRAYNAPTPGTPGEQTPAPESQDTPPEKNSVGLQCSFTADVGTQTDTVMRKDAVVQCPADLQEPIVIEHAYSTRRRKSNRKGQRDSKSRLV